MLDQLSPVMKKELSKPPKILEQCPECKDLVVDSPRYDRLKTISSVMMFGKKIKKVLCQKCIAKFQI